MPPEIDLTKLTLKTDFDPEEQKDYSTNKVGADVEVIFRGQRDRLLDLLTHYPVVLGCVAWLTDMRILRAMADLEEVCILVQKEDFLRPDLTAASDFAVSLRRAYERLPHLVRCHAPGIAGQLSNQASSVTEPIRCDKLNGCARERQHWICQ